jgi:hypothetical protein
MSSLSDFDDHGILLKNYLQINEVSSLYFCI